MKQSFDTWCPLFPGFYNTVFEPDEESLIQQYNVCNNTNYSYEDFEWDYKGYFESIGRGFVERLEAKFQELLPIKIEYQSIYHPKYYNYSNDEVNVRVTVSLNRLLRKQSKNQSLLMNTNLPKTENNFKKCSSRDGPRNDRRSSLINHVG